MSILNTIIKYICSSYPFPSELSNARLTKLVYLTDWESVKINSRQFTEINWYFDNYGPFVHDIYTIAERDTHIEIISTYTFYGTPKTLFRYVGRPPVIDERIKHIIDKVIDDTKSMYWNEFIEHVYNTPPIKGSNRYSFLDLVYFKDKHIS